MPVELMVPLEMLEVGEWAEVSDVSGEQGWVHRLAELGIRKGCRLRVLQQGSPCLLQIGGVRLSLRNHGHTEILVRLLGSSETCA